MVRTAAEPSLAARPGCALASGARLAVRARFVDNVNVDLTSSRPSRRHAREGAPAH